MKKKFNICFVCSGGGHLTELLQIVDSVKEYPKFLVTYEGINNDFNSFDIFYNTYALKWTFSNMAIIFINFINIVTILLKEKPRVVISTGAELAIPFFYLSKIFFGSKLVFLEIYARVNTPSITGKIIYPITDLFLVQWKSLTNKYGKKAKYVGSLA